MSQGVETYGSPIPSLVITPLPDAQRAKPAIRLHQPDPVRQATSHTAPSGADSAGQSDRMRTVFPESRGRARLQAPASAATAAPFGWGKSSEAPRADDRAPQH